MLFLTILKKMFIHGSHSISSGVFKVAFLPDHDPQGSSSQRKFLEAIVACLGIRLLVSIMCQETMLSITDTI